MCPIVFKTRGRCLEGTSEERLGLGIHIWKRPVKTLVNELTMEGIERRGRGLQEGTSLSRKLGERYKKNREPEASRRVCQGKVSAIERFSKVRTN